MKFRRTSMIICLSILILTLLSGCNLRINWRGTSSANHMDYQYTTYSGSQQKNFSMQDGQSILLDYAAEVNKGFLILRINDPDNITILERSMFDDESDHVEFTVEKSGLYTLLIIGEETGGGFTVNWQIK